MMAQFKDEFLLRLPHIDPTYNALAKCKELAAKHNVAEELKTEIDRALHYFKARQEYVHNMTSPASSSLEHIEKETLAHNWAAADTSWVMNPRMITSKMTGQAIKTFVSMSCAKKVLEIGTFTGYGALAMAEALPADGKVVTCELEAYTATLARTLLDNSPHGRKVIIKQGPAIDSLNELADAGEAFDYIFIDADKDGYLQYYDIIMSRGLLAPRGTIHCDNTLYMGFPMTDPEGRGKASIDFNDHIKADKSVHAVLLPVRDGMTLVRRVEDMGDQ